MANATKMRIRKGDTVIVLTGKDKGKSGEVLKVMPKEQRVLVQGVNMVKRHNRPTQVSPGGIDEKEAPLHVSNVAMKDPASGQPTKVGRRVEADGRKLRFARRSGELIDA